MPKVSAKRQITLPIGQCEILGIEPGDEVESFVADGQLTIVKKVKGAAKGILKRVRADNTMTDEESLQSAIK
ncbi:MAG: AbrB/MazE/SpoVT family DNA-binding domain-containing protein [Candidatus Thiodiazotropha sp. (ex Dulcina madagascariensis)]|nr:AbrB/MazE/SpoVT family DNA-binding domain-containing protein [Candidatus Thiodiazotropha sp. (ex Dulcina madagascariensis)]MCU7926383.1 AbrB/MazE/SpoVT family DNA-binding domain-containing protein [Candidatus Thiodiazotropha sp. (ex Dulcina madagascariensis)]